MAKTTDNTFDMNDTMKGKKEIFPGVDHHIDWNNQG